MSDNDVLKKLNEVIKELLPATISAGLEAIGQKIENETKAADYMPVDDGQLRASITHKVDEDESTVYIGSNLEYAPYVHEGTGIYSKDGSGRQTPWRVKTAKGNWFTTQGHEPQPFLQMTVDEHADTLPNVFINLLDVEAKKRGF